MFVCASLFDNITVTGTGLIVLIVLLTAITLIAGAVNIVPCIVHKWELEYKTRDLTYGAVCLAMAYALSWARFVKLPNGGSITPGCLAPLFIYCYYFGFRKGTVVCTAYMLLQFLQGATVVSPWSAFFDYMLPCFSVSLVGLFCYKPQKYAEFVKSNKQPTDTAKGRFRYWAYTIGGHLGIFIGAGLHMLLRYISYTVSGVMNFELWYGESYFWYKLNFSLSYNAFVLIDSAVAMMALLFVMSSRVFNVYLSAAFDDKKALRAAIEASGGEIDSTPHDAPHDAPTVSAKSADNADGTD